MNRAQRILVFVSLLAMAWLLHTTFCEWHYKRDTGPCPIIAVPGTTPPVVASDGTVIRPATPAYTGVWPQHEPISAILVGIVAPLVLLVVAAYLGLGWRHQGRLHLCPKCGYDLKGDLSATSDECPECGWRRRDPRVTTGSS